jgi:hypothetical protein
MTPLFCNEARVSSKEATMRPLKTADGKAEFHAKLKLNNLEAIQTATGLQIDEVFGGDEPIVQLFLSPRKMWKVVQVLIGHAVTEKFPDPDYSELFTPDAVMEWLEALITDFHPAANKSRISNVFRILQSETEAEAVIAKSMERRETLSNLMNNPELIASLMKSPRALEALAGGLAESSESTPVSSVSES